MSIFRHLFLLAALCCAAGSSSARSALYQWVDKDGVTHLDDYPPSAAQRGVRAATVPGKSKATNKNATATKGKPAKKLDWWERSNDAPPDEIDKAARLYNIPSELIRAVIAIESAGDAAARSNKGAVGLMQLMPQTGGQMYVRDLVDPAQNIHGGTRYLRTLANQFNGDMMLVLAAYNAGPEAVRKYGGVPPFDETRSYVRKVMQRYNQYKIETARRGQRFASAESRPASETRP
jgi:soluble lytic murein transglycosylase-like protein